MQIRAIWARSHGPFRGEPDETSLNSTERNKGQNGRFLPLCRSFQCALGRTNGAQKRTRTSTPLRAPAPEAGASTNSAIWARVASRYAAWRRVGGGRYRGAREVSTPRFKWWGTARIRLASRALLVCLARDIATAIVQGRQPASLTSRAMLEAELPLAWAKQRLLLGFA